MNIPLPPPGTIPAMPRNNFERFKLHGSLALVGTALVALSITVANADPYLRFSLVPPAVTGIEAAPSARPYYDGPRYTLREAPSAAVYGFYEPAPANNCGPRSFEVVNVRPGERRCVGN